MKIESYQNQDTNKIITLQTNKVHRLIIIQIKTVKIKDAISVVNLIIELGIVIFTKIKIIQVTKTGLTLVTIIEIIRVFNQEEDDIIMIEIDLILIIQFF